MKMRARRAQSTAAALIWTMLTLPGVSAYVPTRTAKSGKPIAWTATNCVGVRPHLGGSSDINDGSEFEAVRRAMDNWHRSTSECAHLRLLLLAPRLQSVPGFDRDRTNQNVLFFVEQADWPHDPAAAALTTIRYVNTPDRIRDGKILDADIEMNGVSFAFSTDGGPDGTDLENTLTHELGHLIGLDHPCDDGAASITGGDRLDNNGNPLLSCDAASEQIREVTMFNFTDLGELKKRTPESDDVQGYCETYPHSSNPRVCEYTDDRRLFGGCATSGGEAQSPAPAVIVLACLICHRWWKTHSW